jgi:hypothetical protein
MEKRNLPTIAELFEDNLAVAYKNEQLNLLLNNEPPEKWIKTHPFIKGYRYIPIDKIEYLLRKIFKQYRVEILREGTSFNGVYVVVRLHYLNPVTNTMEWHDGIGACQLQTAKGTSPADLININNGALSMAFPIAKTIALKDASDHFGKLFGCDLNRKDTIPFEMDKSVVDKTKQKETERIKLLIEDCKTKEELITLGVKLNPMPIECEEYFNDTLNGFE